MVDFKEGVQHIYSLLRSYKGLKLQLHIPNHQNLACLLRSYKGLKLISSSDKPSSLNRLLRSYKGLKPFSLGSSNIHKNEFITFL